MVTIVVPVLDDTPAVRALLTALPPHPEVQLVLVDGGSDPGLAALVKGRADVRLIPSRPGRGPQLNAGAALASGEWLLFLHADCRLPEGWREALLGLPADAIGGWFRFSLDSRAWQARLLERLVALRVSLTGLAYGDQGLFVRRTVFGRMGGFADLPLMEDVEFVRRLPRAGRVVSLTLSLSSSARRWEQDGWLSRSARNVGVLCGYGLGIPPARLARWYGRRRAQGETSAP